MLLESVTWKLIFFGGVKNVEFEKKGVLTSKKSGNFKNLAGKSRL